MYVLRAFLAKQNKPLEGARIAVQGFGNVGLAAQLFDEMGANIIAVTERKSRIYDENGIDIAAAGLYYRERGELKDYPHGDAISNEELLTCDCEILIPAAMENTVTEDIAPHIKAKIVVEAANGPTTPEADEILRENGVTVLPDILANAGGVTVGISNGCRDCRTSSGR